MALGNAPQAGEAVKDQAPRVLISNAGDQTPAETMAGYLEIMTMASRKPAGYHYSGRADFVQQHGQAYPARPRPRGYRRGRPRLCFNNSAERARDDASVTYCEGYAWDPWLPFPIPHAWLIGADGGVIDLTWDWQDTDPAGAHYAPLGVLCGVTIPTATLRVVWETCSAWGGILEDYENAYPIFRAPYAPDGLLARYRAIYASQREELSRGAVIVSPSGRVSIKRWREGL